jgi:gas vesicle protein
MKNLSILAAFFGGAVAGAAVGLLFAPEKGDDTRHRIAEALRKRGISLGKGDLRKLVDEIANEIKGEDEQEITNA